MWVALAGAAGLGSVYGYVSHRGAFCMNSGFAAAASGGDTAKIRAFALAVAVQMVALPVIVWFGLAEPSLPLMAPAGAVVGGLLFGAAMPWAGGCAAGVWYKLGAGDIAAAASVVGLALGAAALEVGPLAGVRASIQTFGSAATLDLPAIPWVVAATLGLLALAALARSKPSIAGAWPWKRTGLLIGVVGAAAWPVSALAARNFGMAIVPGSVALATTPAASLGSWDAVFVLGIPLGAFIAARVASVPPSPRPPPEKLAKRLVGGLGLGAGASLAAGCTVGHGLAGLSLLAPGSILAMASIFAGRALVARASARAESGT